MKYKDVFLLAFILIFANNSFAKMNETYEFYNGIREMGMGGATVAVVNDETALILNPAALGKLRDSYFTVFDPEIHGDSTAGRVYNADGYKTNPQALLDNLKTRPDKHHNASAYLFPSFVVPNFGVGLLGTYNYDAQVNSTGNTFDMRYRNDYAFILGYNFKFFDGIIKLGFNAKYINRVEADTTVPASSSGLSWADYVNEGVGISSDIGLILTAPLTYLPSLAVVWRDVGDTDYSFSHGLFFDNRPYPSRTDQTVDVGLSVSPILGKRVRMQISAEVQDVLTLAKEQDKSKRYHAGVEFNIYDRLFIRGGMNQRYWTAGLEVSGFFMQFQAASWGEEIGTPTQHKEDRRYGVKFAIRF